MHKLITYNSWRCYFDITFEAAWKEANLNDGVEIKTRPFASARNPGKHQRNSPTRGESLSALSRWFTFKKGLFFFDYWNTNIAGKLSKCSTIFIFFPKHGTVPLIFFHLFIYFQHIWSLKHIKMLSEQEKPVLTRQNQTSSTLSTAAEAARPCEATWWSVLYSHIL